VETPTTTDADFALVITSGDRFMGRCCHSDCTLHGTGVTCSYTTHANCSGSNDSWSSEDTCLDPCDPC
jgi:hypothetical protein